MATGAGTSPMAPGPGDDDPFTVTEEEIAAARAARLAARTTGPADAEPEIEPAPADDADAPAPSRRRNAAVWAIVVGGAVVVAILVRTFAFQQFWIPSASMSTTLVTNDRVVVNKLAYRFHDVHRGDVVVFERPKNTTGDIKDLIKRVVGLPGERVSITDGKVHIDGRLLDEPYTHGLETDANVGCGAGDTKGIETTKGLEIPDGEVLVLGDNRVDSQDGRCFGPIHTDTIVGRAFVIVWPPSKVGGL